jgi:ActR/RegA family two-component response regulator
VQSSGYSPSVAGRLFLIEDDLMFAQRARAAGDRLGVEVEAVTPVAAPTRKWHDTDVVLLQATLRPERQLALVERLMASRPPPIVVAVTGHLETALRHRLRGYGVRLAAHSAMDRAIARALGLNAGDAGDARDAPARPDVS